MNQQQQNATLEGAAAEATGGELTKMAKSSPLILLLSKHKICLTCMKAY